MNFRFPYLLYGDAPEIHLLNSRCFESNAQGSRTTAIRTKASFVVHDFVAVQLSIWLFAMK
jgi:hypothetical protein